MDPDPLLSPVVADQGDCEGCRETTAHAAAQRAVLGAPGALAAAKALPKDGPCARHFDKTWLRIRLRQ